MNECMPIEQAASPLAMPAAERPRQAWWQGFARRTGFTLIELMIVVAIVAILAAIAYPSYISHIVKTKRVAAEGCLAEYANYMERYYTTNLRYDKDSSGANNVLPTLDCASNGQTGTSYSYSFSSGEPTKSTFKIQAVPQGTQNARDTQCGTLTLDQTGMRVVSGSGGLAKCW